MPIDTPVPVSTAETVMRWLQTARAVGRSDQPRRGSTDLFLSPPPRLHPKIVGACGQAYAKDPVGFYVPMNDEIAALIDAHMIYPHTQPHAYYLDILESGSVLLKYNQILGSRLLCRLGPQDLDALMQRYASQAAECLGAGAARMAPVPAVPSEVAGTSAEAPAGRAIDSDVLRVLRAGRTDGERFHLPAGLLERKLYERTNAVLNELGGRWKGGKIQAHVFDGAADEALAAALLTGRYVSAKDFGFFPTPPAVVERVLALAGLRPGMLVFEPQAGTGGIALPASEIVGLDNVHACELLERNVATLRGAGLTHITHGDFLQMPPNPIFDAVMMNPPFAGLQDVAHVLHAARFLNPRGRLVSVMAPGYSFRTIRKAADFRDFLAAAQAEEETIDAGAFHESGTDIATRLVAFDACNLPWYQAPTATNRPRQRA